MKLKKTSDEFKRQQYIDSLSKKEQNELMHRGCIWKPIGIVCLIYLLLAVGVIGVAAYVIETDHNCKSCDNTITKQSAESMAIALCQEKGYGKYRNMVGWEDYVEVICQDQVIRLDRNSS